MEPTSSDLNILARDCGIGRVATSRNVRTILATCVDEAIDEASAETDTLIQTGEEFGSRTEGGNTGLKLDGHRTEPLGFRGGSFGVCPPKNVLNSARAKYTINPNGAHYSYTGSKVAEFETEPTGNIQKQFPITEEKYEDTDASQI